MAAIEKICELTGDYPSFDMYRFKRNQLQIMPSARPLFRGAGATLYVQRDKLYWHSKSGFRTEYDPSDMDNYLPPFNTISEWIEYKKEVEQLRLVQHHIYAFVTDNPELQGSVNGAYINWTHDLSSVKRKMKRLLRCKKLNIVYVDDLSAFLKGRH